MCAYLHRILSFGAENYIDYNSIIAIIVLGNQKNLKKNPKMQLLDKHEYEI